MTTPDPTPWPSSLNPADLIKTGPIPSDVTFPPAPASTAPDSRPVLDAPWPVVWECHWPAPSLVKQGHSCAQCDGSHAHVWVAWPDSPDAVGTGIPVRCRTCGGRKCDVSTCLLRRHHGGDHEHF
jgi:hypothetical protein